MQIDSVIKNSAAQKAGLQKGDKVISVNGIATYWYNDFAKQIIKSRNLPCDDLVNVGINLIAGVDRVFAAASGQRRIRFGELRYPDLRAVKHER